MYEDDIRYAQKRLIGTIISFQKVCHYVDNVSDRGVVRLITEDPKNEKQVKLKDLLQEDFPLGYIKTREPNAWVWVYRMPLRNEWKHGLTPANVRGIYNGQPENKVLLRVGDLDMCLTNQYSSKEYCIENGGAFSRNFCVEGGKLFHKGVLVGDVVDNHIELHPGFTFLQRRLELSQ